MSGRTTGSLRHKARAVWEVSHVWSQLSGLVSHSHTFHQSSSEFPCTNLVLFGLDIMKQTTGREAMIYLWSGRLSEVVINDLQVARLMTALSQLEVLRPEFSFSLAASKPWQTDKSQCVNEKPQTWRRYLSLACQPLNLTCSHSSALADPTNSKLGKSWQVPHLKIAQHWHRTRNGSLFSR